MTSNPTPSPTTTTVATANPPAPPDLIHRIFAGIQHEAQTVGTAAQNAVTVGIHSLNPTALYASLAPELKAAYEKILPPALAAGSVAVADLVSPASWSQILTAAGPMLAAFIQGVLQRDPGVHAIVQSPGTPPVGASISTTSAK